MKETPNFLTCPAVCEVPPRSSEHGVSGSNKPESGKAKRHGPSWKFLAWCLAAILILAAVVPPAIAVVRAGLSAQQAKQELDALKALAQNGDFAAAAERAAAARRSLNDAREALSGVGFWRDVPYVGTQVRAVQDVTIVSADSLEGAEDLLSVAQSLGEALEQAQQALPQTKPQVESGRKYSDLSKEEKRALLEALARALPKIRMARVKLDVALKLWNDIPQDRLAGPLKQALDPLAKLLPTVKRSLDQAVPLIDTLVPLAGYPTPQHYLIALQNSDEMRPSGGFIGSVATAALDGGDLRDFEFFDVYAIDKPVMGSWKEVPPKPLKDHLNVTAWFMRDANWSPDFPSSADRVLDFYNRELAAQNKTPKNPPTVFVAVEPGLFRSLLRLSGPVTVQGTTVNEANFMDVIETQVEQTFLEQGIPVEQRKGFMAAVGDELIKKLQALPASRWPDVLNVVTVALERKQIMLYSRSNDIQKMIDERDWGGRAKPTDGDFVWAVDANLAALKTDGVMHKAIDYTVDARDPQKPVATVTLRYRNDAPGFTWRYTRYRSYTRVYAPEGSELLEAKGAMAGDLLQTRGKFVAGKTDVMKELGKTAFGAFWAIEPGKTGELSFTYRLPSSVSDRLANGDYRLDWVKQPGADDTEINVKILLPRNVAKAEPPETEAKWGDATYEIVSDTSEDRSFSINF